MPSLRSYILRFMIKTTTYYIGDQDPGIEVTLKIWHKMWHNFHTSVPFLPEAKVLKNFKKSIL